MTDFDQTPLTDDDMDQLLRDAGARMRATAPGTVTPSPHRDEHRRNRWIVPVTLGAVAAAVIALVVGLARDPDESISNVPADKLEDEVEPFLLRLGFVQRTPRGRMITAAALAHLGLELPPKDRTGQRRLF